MLVYTPEQRCDFGKKNHLFRWSSHLGHRKPARIYWKVDAPKTSHCLVQILVQRHNCGHFSLKISKERPLQSMAIVTGPCLMNFCLQKLKRRMLATFGFNRTTLCATLDVLRPIFEDRISSRRADIVWPPRSCDLTPLDYYLWGAVKDKIKYSVYSVKYLKKGIWRTLYHNNKKNFLSLIFKTNTI